MLPEERLANAIVEQAAHDYRKMLRGRKETPKCNKSELEKFFKSQWFQELTTVNGEYLMRALREDEEDKDSKHIAKVYISMQGELNKKRR